jgi:hypothetical protein
VVDYSDGRLSIRYKGVELAYRTFDKIQQVDQGAIVENKRLGAVLAFMRDEQFGVDHSGAARKRHAGAISATRVFSSRLSCSTSRACLRPLGKNIRSG